MNSSTLEDQLRSMILSNATSTANNPPQAQAHTQTSAGSSVVSRALDIQNSNVSTNSASSSTHAAGQRGHSHHGHHRHHRPPHTHGHGGPPQEQPQPDSRSRGPPHPRRGSPHHRGYSVPHHQSNEPPGAGAGHFGPSHHPSPRGRGYCPPHMRNQSTPGAPYNSGSPQQPRTSWPHSGPHPRSSQYGPRFGPRPQDPGLLGPMMTVPPPGFDHPPQILQRSLPAELPESLGQTGPRYPSGSYPGGFRHSFPFVNKQHLETQSAYLDGVATIEIPKVAMSDQEMREKQEFVEQLQKICQLEISSMPDVPSLEFTCFGSVGTGFATKGSDIDLAVVASAHEDAELAEKVGPRALEKIFLDKGFGARLLTHTRVPIIKFCENPSDRLLENLREERKKWDDLPEDQKEGKDDPAEHADEGENPESAEGKDLNHRQDIVDADRKMSASSSRKPNNALNKNHIESQENGTQKSNEADGSGSANPDDPSTPKMVNQEISFPEGDPQGAGEEKKEAQKEREPRPERPWLREKPLGPLDFPKDGVGIQCDLNFSGHLGIYNTKLLYCYGISDPRARDMVIFVKAWAKTRKINSSYNGTLSSYGYALMVLHYLMRVPGDPVLRDLQFPHNQQANGRTPTWVDTICNDVRVKFLNDEEYIKAMGRKGQWTHNKESLGSLLRGFFRYYGCPGQPDRVGGFHWTRDVITFGQRSPWERLVTKQELGWTQARTEQRDKNKEVRHRYLVAIQDPFELSHNVGRTVTHQGICAIREEFRRAWRILELVAMGQPHKELFASIEDDPPPPQSMGGTPKDRNAAHEGGKDAQSRHNEQGAVSSDQKDNSAMPQTPNSMPVRRIADIAEARATIAVAEAVPALSGGGSV